MLRYSIGGSLQDSRKSNLCCSQTLCNNLSKINLNHYFSQYKILNSESLFELLHKSILSTEIKYYYFAKKLHYFYMYL